MENISIRSIYQNPSIAGRGFSSLNKSLDALKVKRNDIPFPLRDYPNLS